MNDDQVFEFVDFSGGEEPQVPFGEPSVAEKSVEDRSAPATQDHQQVPNGPQAPDAMRTVAAAEMAVPMQFPPSVKTPAPVHTPATVQMPATMRTPVTTPVAPITSGQSNVKSRKAKAIAAIKGNGETGPLFPPLSATRVVFIAGAGSRHFDRELTSIHLPSQDGLGQAKADADTWVQRLFDAVLDRTEERDKPRAESSRALFVDNHYSQQHIVAGAQRLFEETIKYHEKGSQLAECNAVQVVEIGEKEAEKKGLTPDKDLPISERLEHLVNALKQWKSVCVSVMGSIIDVRKILRAPQGCVKEKDKNYHSNLVRKAQGEEYKQIKGKGMSKGKVQQAGSTQQLTPSSETEIFDEDDVTSEPLERASGAKRQWTGIDSEQDGKKARLRDLSAGELSSAGSILASAPQ